MRTDRSGSFRMYFLPRERLLREQPVHGSWMRVEPAQAAALSALAGGLQPFPAAKLPYARRPMPDTTPVPNARPAPRVATTDARGFPWLITLAAGLVVAGAARGIRVIVRMRGPATGSVK